VAADAGSVQLAREAPGEALHPGKDSGTARGAVNGPSGHRRSARSSSTHRRARARVTAVEACVPTVADA
jgi:hypothetical protein